ncbi:MAG: ribonuclease E/G, partial [Pseudomonadota bacterium]
RIRASVLESTMQVCDTCGGTGYVRSVSSLALHVLRTAEEHLLKKTTHNITIRTTPELALYILNQKRDTIIEFEERFGLAIEVAADANVGLQHIAIDQGTPVDTPVVIEGAVQVDTDFSEELENTDEADVTANEHEDEGNGRKRKRRRRRRGGRNGEDRDDQAAVADAGDSVTDASANRDERSEEEGEGRKKRRRRGKRGGKRNREQEATADTTAESSASESDAADIGHADSAAPVEVVEINAEPDADATIAEDSKPKRRRSSRKKTDEDVAAAETQAESVAVATEADSVTEEPAAASEVEAAPSRTTRRRRNASSEENSEPKLTSTVAESDDDGSDDSKPKKAGWWQRRGFF